MRLESDGTPEPFRRRAGIAAPDLDIAQAYACFVVGRGEIDDVPADARCFVVQTLRFQRCGKIQVGLDVARIACDCLAEQRDGFPVPARFYDERAKLIEGLCISGAPCKYGAIARFGLRVAPGFVVRLRADQLLIHVRMPCSANEERSAAPTPTVITAQEAVENAWIIYERSDDALRALRWGIERVNELLHARQLTAREDDCGVDCARLRRVVRLHGLILRWLGALLYRAT